jgi:hypothetical protein
MAIPTYVPLIISIFALVLPILNTLRVFFETAEGYRKCSEAVIGPWSNLRWRKWSWSELRFETHFVTPKIVLHSISEERVQQDLYKTRYLMLRGRNINNKEVKQKLAIGRWPSVWWRYVSSHWRLSSAKRADALYDKDTVLDASLTSDPDTHKQQVSSGLVAASDEEKVSGTLLHDTGVHFTSEQKVSWLTFLRHLYKIENISLSPQEPHANRENHTREIGLLVNLGESFQRPNLSRSRYSTGVSLSFIEWTWDSLPAKATRPMACTNVGTLVVMAIRLGMDWRIDLKKDTFLAVGNGYSLSCTHVPEMGLVASFTADETEERKFDHSLAFNRQTDMLMCGIIPGANLLVDVNFRCTDDSGRTDVLKGVLDVIDPHDRLRRRLQPDQPLHEDHVRGLNMLADEMMALLCELPLEMERGKVADVYCFPSGRSSSRMTSDAWFNTFIRRVMDEAWEDVLHDIRNAFERTMILQYRTPVLGDVKRLSYCQRLYDETTVWFLSKGFGERFDGHTYYVHLVAAHCLMSHDAWETTQACFKNSRTVYPDENDSATSTRHSRDENGHQKKETVFPDKVIEICGRAFHWKEEKPPVELQLEALALIYLDKLRNREGGLKKYHRELLHHSPVPVPKEEAWMVLMLRSLAWSMATTRRKSFGSGRAIPSSCWDSQRPVWMI